MRIILFNNKIKYLLQRFKRVSICNYLKIKNLLTNNLSLSELYYLNNIKITEGHSKQIPKQVSLLQTIINDNSINSLLEIGFNAIRKKSFHQLFQITHQINTIKSITYKQPCSLPSDF